MAHLTMPIPSTRNNYAAIKRLQPGAPGAKGLVERFGNALLCASYRHDSLRNCRQSTVEPVIKERPTKLEKTAWICVAYSETNLRQRIKKAGGTRHPERKLWLLPLKTIKSLKLEARRVADA